MATILTRVPVAVEKTAAGRFIARADVTDVRLEAEGDTAEDAVAKLQARAEPMVLPATPPGGNPWLAVAGMWKGVDPAVIAGWRAAVEENRQRQHEEDEKRLREEEEEKRLRGEAGS